MICTNATSNSKSSCLNVTACSEHFVRNTSMIYVRCRALNLTDFFQLALHYSGSAPGPGLPFGIDIGDFARESETLLFADPSLTCARSRILDYFSKRNAGLQDDHFVLRFHVSNRVSTGDSLLVNQICVQMGFERTPSIEHDAAAYISGRSPEIIENYPELGAFRDIVFYLKLMMSPSMEELPPLRRWEARDAALQWDFQDVQSGGFPGFRKTACVEWRILAFGRNLSAVRQTDAGDRGLLSRLLHSEKKKPRAPPSGADPELVVGPGIRVEDDILHVPNSKLPRFGCRLCDSDTELLCQYLTVPYLRIPLLLDFFRYLLN